MSVTEDVNIIQRALPNIKRGSLRFFGNWFGRPYDNFHNIINALEYDDTLVLEFDSGEKLTVKDPGGVIATQKEFVIRKSTHVRWEWFHYGKPRTSENLYFLDYLLEDSRIIGTTNVDWYTHDFSIIASAPAVEIC